MDGIRAPITVQGRSPGAELLQTLTDVVGQNSGTSSEQADGYQNSKSYVVPLRHLEDFPSKNASEETLVVRSMLPDLTRSTMRS